MSIVVEPYTFKGPFTDLASIENRPGVFVIHCCHDGEYSILDVGVADSLSDWLSKHEHWACWDPLCEGTWTLSVIYKTADCDRSPEEVEQDIRRRFQVRCPPKARPSEGRRGS